MGTGPLLLRIIWSSRYVAPKKRLNVADSTRVMALHESSLLVWEALPLRV